MNKISVCMIAKNEESNIEKCLLALQPYNLEIILADTGSTDDTKGIAGKYTNNIYDFTWVDDFSAARNFSISKASSDWILILDCDEYLDPFDIEDLYSQLSKHEKGIGSISIKNLTKTHSGEETYVTMPASRLFNKHYYHFQNTVHEQLVPNSSLIHAYDFETGLSVIHTGYTGSNEFLQKKQQRNIALLEKHLLTAAQAEKAYLYFQLGQSYKKWNPDKSLSYYRLAFEHNPNIHAPYFKFLTVEYGYALYYNNGAEAAIQFLENYHSALISHGDYAFLLGFLYMNNTEYSKAIELFQKALASGDCSAQGINSYLSHYNLGLIYQLLGQWENASCSFNRCLDHKDSRERLSAVDAKHKDSLPLSICIIGKNEENFLNECLRRLIPLNCEIIFTDTGSTDRTLEIASQYTKNIYHFKWINDFSAARNFSISKASNDWILVVDCDEFLENPEELALTLPAYLQSLNTRRGEVGIVTINSKCLQKGSDTFSADKVARFFSKEYSHFEGIVHEQILSLSGEVFPRFMTPFSFSHMGYYGDELNSIKFDRNRELLLTQLNTNGPSPYIYYQLGKAYYSVKDYGNALHYLDLGLSMDVDPSYDYVHGMVETYGYTLLELGLIEDALGLEGVYDTFCIYADFVFLMGLIYMKNGLFNEAINEFKKAPAFTDASAYGANSFMAYYNIGVIYECTGNKKEAIDYYKKCNGYPAAEEGLFRLHS